MSNAVASGAAVRHNNTLDGQLDRVYVDTRHFSSKTVEDAPPNRYVLAQNSLRRLARAR